MQDHARVGERRALAGRAGGEQHRADRDRLSHTGGRDIRADVAHGVVDGEHGAGVAAFAVDVELDVALGALRLQVEELGDERVRHAGIDGRPEIDDALGEQVRVDIHDPFTTRVLGDDVRDRVAGHRSPPARSLRNPVRSRAGGAISSKLSTMPSMKP